MLKNKTKIIAFLLILILAITSSFVYADNETSKDSYKNSDVYLMGDNVTIDYVVDGAENKKVNIKELDEKQDTRLSTARYQIQTNEQNTEETQSQEEKSVNNTTQQIEQTLPAFVLY